MSIWETVLNLGRSGVFGPVGAAVAAGLSATTGPGVYSGPRGFTQFKAAGTSGAIGRALAVPQTRREIERREQAQRRYGFQIGTPGGYTLGGALEVSPRTRALAMPGATRFYRRYRRMNPGNFRALSRAIRRVERFEKAARRVIRITHPGHRGSVHVVTHRRRKR